MVTISQGNVKPWVQKIWNVVFALGRSAS